MSSILDIHIEDLRKEIGSFDALIQNEHIADKTTLLTKSQGAAINEINDCLKAFETYCASINNLYAATSTYLHKVMDDIDACEDATKLKELFDLSKEK